MPSPGRSDTSTCPCSMRIGRAVASSVRPSLERVKPHAICGSAAAMCVAAAQAMLDSPVLAETLTLSPSRSHSAARLHHAAQPAELDGLQAHAARGAALVMAADVLERMDAFVGADRESCRMPPSPPPCRQCRRRAPAVRRKPARHRPRRAHIVPPSSALQPWLASEEINASRPRISQTRRVRSPSTSGLSMPTLILNAL